MAAPARLGVDPDLLKLHGARRPGGGLGLEEDHAALDPEPRTAIVDLRLGAPTKRLRIACEGIEVQLELVRGRARRHEPVDIGASGGSQARLAGRRRLGDRVDRLMGPVLPGGRQQPARLLPELAHGAELADDHARVRLGGDGRERRRARAGGNDVGARMAQARQRAGGVGDGAEASETASCHVLEEHTLDRIARAVLQHLLPRWLEDGHATSLL